MKLTIKALASLACISSPKQWVYSSDKTPLAEIISIQKNVFSYSSRLENFFDIPSEI